MAEESVQRRLAAILAADVAGYSRLMGADEAGTRARFNDFIDEVIRPAIDEHRGRLVKTMGDGFLTEFGSVVDAVQCAADIQSGVAAREKSEPGDRKMLLRIGLHLGDVIVEGEDIHGDGVNIAARLEGLAEPGGICVSDMVHAGVRHKLSLGFSDLGEQSLKNIADPVRVFGVVLDTTARQSAISSDALFRRPAVAVLPFQNLSGDPDQEYFADGLTEDVITTLSLWRSFPVVARNSTFAYKGKSPDVRKVGEELGARYVIEGSVRKVGNRVRVTAQLINTETGHHVWAERYDRDLEDIFALQDDLTERIAATAAPEIERAVRGGSLASQQTDLDAWDTYQRWMAHQYEYTQEGNERAREMFRRAIEIDPAFSKAYAALGFTYLNDNLLGFSQSVEENRQHGLENAKRAVELDNTDPTARFTLGIAYAQLQQHEWMKHELEAAVELNPFNSRAVCSLGHMYTLLGDPERAVLLVERGLRLSPRDTSNHIYFSLMARALFSLGRYDETIEWAKKSIHLKAEVQEPYHMLAACLGHLGRQEEGKEALKACEAYWPQRSQQWAYFMPYTKPDDQEHFLEGLRQAGWEG